MQTPEDRIRRHHKALKRQVYRDGGSKQDIFMWLARVWRMPIKSIKEIVKGDQP